jgi:uncharacterized hydrophobic protein (TIGR00341 family)
MKYLEVVLSAKSLESVKKIAENVKADDLRFDEPSSDGMQRFRMIVHDKDVQEALDSFSHIMGAHPTAKVVVMPIEAYLPKQDEEKPKSVTTARESIYQEVAKNAQIDSNYIVLVVLSTIVATIGLIEDNVAVVIGAMVIAPLLGPNLAFSFGTSIGDKKLMVDSIKTMVLGLIVASAIAFGIGISMDVPLSSHELMLRTDISIETFLLALASGAAAALSITAGLSSVLVGVMVAVAILPPTATFALMAGSGEFDLAVNAGILLAINIVSVNLATKIVFVTKGITPRHWYDKERAKKAMTRYIIGWFLTLLSLLVFMILFYKG